MVTALDPSQIVPFEELRYPRWPIRRPSPGCPWRKGYSRKRILAKAIYVIIFLERY